MRKPILSLLCFLALLSTCLPAIAEQEPFEIRRITKAVIQNDGDSAQSETGITEYDERGLVTSAEIDSSSMTAHYNFFYEYDVHGNPKTVTVVDAEENSTQRTVTHELQTEYSGDGVVSVSGPVIWGMPLYNIIGEFIGYRNATISDSSSVLRNQDGHLVSQRTQLGHQDRYIEQQWEYDGDRLVRQSTTEFYADSEQNRNETIYRPDGLPELFIQTVGEIVTRGEVTYEDGLDEDGIPCLIGRVNYTSTAEIDNSSHLMVHGYLYEDGSIETRTQESDENGVIYSIVTRNDSHGSQVYQELIVNSGDTWRIIICEYEYR